MKPYCTASSLTGAAMGTCWRLKSVPYGLCRQLPTVLIWASWLTLTILHPFLYKAGMIKRKNWFQLGILRIRVNMLIKMLPTCLVHLAHLIIYFFAADIFCYTIIPLVHLHSDS